MCFYSSLLNGSVLIRLIVFLLPCVLATRSQDDFCSAVNLVNLIRDVTVFVNSYTKDVFSSVTWCPLEIGKGVIRDSRLSVDEKRQKIIEIFKADRTRKVSEDSGVLGVASAVDIDAIHPYVVT